MTIEFVKKIAKWKPSAAPSEPGGMSIIDVVDEALQIVKAHKKTPSVLLQKGWMESEKGNTMLSNDDGAFVGWVKLSDQLMLEITNTPGNSPQFYVSVEDWNPKRLRKHVIDNLEGWYVDRWNIDDKPPIDCGNYVRKPKKPKKD